MENVALSDSNDELTDEITGSNNQSHTVQRIFSDQQHVANELQDAANTDVTKASFLSSINTPFKPLFPAPVNTSQMPTTNSPLVFQQNPTLNPLLQQPTSVSHLPSPLIQPSIRPPSMPSTFQPASSAFTPLNPTNAPPTSSLIQPKLTIGNPLLPPPPPPSSSLSSVPITQPFHYPTPIVPSTQTNETSTTPSAMIIPPSQPESQILPPPPPTSSTTILPPPSIQTGTSAATNPYSARASLTERIYPSMPTSQAPLQPQQLPPPINFQPQAQPSIPPSTSNLFVPPSPATNSTTPNVYSVTDTNMYTPSYQPPVEPNPAPWSNYPPTPTGYDQQSIDPSNGNQTGIWGWISNNKMLATVVEKAKTGLETVITTVDPQMKQYIQPGHEVHIVVTSAKDVKLTPVRDAFTHVFGRATTQGIGVQSNVAPQPVGFEAGFKGAQQRIENLRRQNVVRPDQCIVSIENFIAELVPDMYFDLGYVLLSDPLNSIELHLFTQAIPVPIEYVYQARDRTPVDYPLKWSGYMVTVGEILHSQNPFINPEDWHETMSGTSRRDIIYATCRSLAYMYKQRLNRKQ